MATGDRIVGAFLGRLMTQWFDEITLERVAADAGVTVQTVVRRFGGKEGLLADAVQVMAEQINASRVTPPGDVRGLVARLTQDYERTGDAVVRLLALEPRHAALKKFLDVGRRWHRAWVEGVLSGPLSGLESAARERAVDALVLVTDVYTWHLLRRDMGKAPDAAAAIMERLLRATIAEFTGQAPKETHDA